MRHYLQYIQTCVAQKTITFYSSCLRGIVCKNGAIYGHSESGVITLIRP